MLLPPTGGKVFKRNWSRMPLEDGPIADRPPLCPRQIAHLRLRQPKLLRLELRQLCEDFLRADGEIMDFGQPRRQMRRRAVLTRNDAGHPTGGKI